MLQVLANRTYRCLFAAQVLALMGTGLLTVALALLAHDLAGADAGRVLGTALALKMVAYVTIAPVAGAVASRLPRRALLVSLDFVRAGIALLLPFITEVWQIYVLIFLLQSASAAFTPTFQATIPDVLPDEREYTRALSLSRLAYDLENVLSPMLAAALLAIVSYHWLFGGTVVGFSISAALVLLVTLPRPKAGRQEGGGLWRTTTRGIRIYLGTARLRGLLAMTLAVAAASAMVLVNTVVIVRSLFARPESDLALALLCFGGGSMLAALGLPRLLDRVSDRAVMLPAAALLAAVLLGAAASFWAGLITWPGLLLAWLLLGLGCSAVQTPAGRLLRRSAEASDRPAVFAAQFSLSHACWLLTYPLAGWLGVVAGIPATLAVLGLLALTGGVVATILWRGTDSAHDLAAGKLGS